MNPTIGDLLHRTSGGKRRNTWDRFWSKVDTTGLCWEWTASRNAKGYGCFRVADRRNATAHRVAWEMLVGVIPEGMQLDHLCRNRSCVNPDHLEVVDGRTNTLRGNAMSARWARRTHCNYGHPFDEENTRVWGNDGRRCAQCQSDRAKARRARRREAAAA